MDPQRAERGRATAWSRLSTARKGPCPAVERAAAGPSTAGVKIIVFPHRPGASRRETLRLRQPQMGGGGSANWAREFPAAMVCHIQRQMPGGSAAGTFSVKWLGLTWRKRRGHIRRQMARPDLEEAPRAHSAA